MGGKSNQAAQTPKEAPNNLESAQRLEIVDLIGEGELATTMDLKRVYFNDTPVQDDDNSYNFKGLKVEANNGGLNQQPLKGFEATKRSVAVSAEVKKSQPLVRTITDPLVDELIITLGVQGLSKTEENGDRVGSSVQFLIEIGKNGVYEKAQEITISGKTSSVYYADAEINGLPSVPFNIRVSRITDDANTDRIVDKSLWASYTEIIHAKLSYPHSAVVGIKIDSDQFGNAIPRRNYLVKGLIIKVPSNYDPITRSYSGIWNGDFKPAWSDNPAWILYDLVTNDRYGLGKSLGVFDCDKWALYEVAKYCDELVDDGQGGKEPRLCCNAYIGNSRDAYELINDLASTFRGLALWNGKTLTVVQDRPTDPIWRYTNANVVDGKFDYSYVGRKAITTVVHVQYVDKNDGYRTKTEYLADNELLKRYGENIKKVTAFGCTSRSQAVRYGQWLLETAKRQQCTVSFKVGSEGMMHLPYDVIEVVDNAYIGTISGGRILKIVGNIITLDNEVGAGDKIIINAREYTIRNRINKTQIEVVNLEASVGDVWVVQNPQLSPRLFRAISVEENNDDGTYTITALEHHNDKDIRVDVAQKRDSLITLSPEIYNPSINLDGKDIKIQWDSNYTGGLLQYETKLYRNGELYRTIELSNVPQTQFSNLPEGKYEIHIRAKTIGGDYSRPVVYGFSIDYRITGLRTKQGFQSIDLIWTLPNIATTELHTEIWYGKNIEQAKAKLLVKLSYPQNSYTLTGVSVTDTYYFWARVVDDQGNTGVWSERVVGHADPNPAPIVAQLQGAITENTLSHDLIAQLDGKMSAVAHNAERNAAVDAAAKMAEATLKNTNALRDEAQARAAAIQAEAEKREAAINAEIDTRVEAIKNEAQAREQALQREVANRNAAINTEAQKQTAHLTTKAAEIGTRISAVETVNQQQAQRLNTLIAAQGNTVAALETEKQARIAGDHAESTARETLATRLGNAETGLNRETQARAAADNAQTAEINNAKSQIAGNAAQINEIKTTKADKNEVVSIAQTGLQSHWQAAADAAKNAAVADAQAKVNAAKAAAETAAQAKADAAKAQAIAAASGDAQAKANAAKAASIADAAAKDAVLKQQAAADAQAKADAAKNAAIAEANRLNAATDAKITQLSQTVTNQNSAAARQLDSLRAQVNDATIKHHLLVSAGLGAYNTSAGVFNAAGAKTNDITRGLSLIIFANNGDVESVNSYDLYGSPEAEATRLGAAINALPNDKLVAVLSFDAFRREGLIVVAPQLYKIGASHQTIDLLMNKLNGNARHAYLLVGGKHLNAQVEMVSDTSETARLQYLLQLKNGRPVSMAGHQLAQTALAEITAHREAQATVDAAQTAEINNAKSQIAGNTAQINNLKQTVVNQNGATTNQINTVSAELNTAKNATSAQIQQAQTAVTVLNGKVQALHTVRVEAISGGRKAVAGLALGADGATGDSQFLVRADKFALVRTGDSAADITVPFVVQTVGGQTKLALNGDMIATGSIHGNHIAAGQTLSSPIINGGSLNIGNGRFVVNNQGQVSISSQAGNVGLKINNNLIEVYDERGQSRIKLGQLF